MSSTPRDADKPFIVTTVSGRPLFGGKRFATTEDAWDYICEGEDSDDDRLFIKYRFERVDGQPIEELNENE